MSGIKRSSRLPLLPLRGWLVLLLFQMWSQSVIVSSFHDQSSSVSQSISHRPWSKLASLGFGFFSRVYRCWLSLWHLVLLRSRLDHLLLNWRRHLDRRIRESQRLYILPTLAWAFLQSACISESVEGMIGTRASGRDASYHDDSNPICIHGEGVSQNHSQLASSEGYMHILSSVLLQVQAPYAFFKSQQTLVNLSSFQSSLSVVALCVSCSLTSSQVYEEQLAHQFPIPLFDMNLANGVTS